MSPQTLRKHRAPPGLGYCLRVQDHDTAQVRERIRSTDADRARFLGLAFTATFTLALIGDLAGMGTLANHGFMIAQLVLSLGVVVVVHLSAAARARAATVFAVGMSAVSAAGAAHLAQFGGLDGPWFYGSYTAPPVMIPMLFSLRARVGFTFTTVVAFVAVYVLKRPDTFDHPMGHVPIMYLVTISGISIALGHYVYRLEVGSFVDVVRLDAAAAVLEAQLRAGEAQPAALRQHIARQLHDDVAQLITGARLHLDGWRGPDAKDDAARRLAELLDELARRSRRMLDDLRAPPTRGALAAELERLRLAYAKDGLVVDVLCDVVNVDVDAAHVDAIVGAVREALTNALRHARASEATVAVDITSRSIDVAVLDNGGGRAADVREGNGLRGMRERVAEVGGAMTLGDHPDGLRVMLVVPRGAAGAL
jgi:signal transduction histidine kinase